jgi:hypothetical protein
MKKLLLLLCATAAIAYFVAGCGPTKRKYYYTTETVSSAPVVTYNITFVDNFTEEDRLELINSVAAIFSQAIAAIPPTTVNNVTITITADKIGPIHHHSHHNVLTEAGDNNECPHLFEQLCEKFKDNKNKKDKD